MLMNLAHVFRLAYIEIIIRGKIPVITSDHLENSPPQASTKTDKLTGSETSGISFV